VTHDQTEALSMSDRIIRDGDGPDRAGGTPRALYQQPVNRFVADFIGNGQFPACACAVGREWQLEKRLAGRGRSGDYRDDGRSRSHCCVPRRSRLDDASAQPVAGQNRLTAASSAHVSRSARRYIVEVAPTACAPIRAARSRREVPPFFPSMRETAVWSTMWFKPKRDLQHAG